MASTIVEVQLPSSLSSPTLSLYAAGSDTLANSDGADTLTEKTNALGFYTATVTEALAGIYAVKVLVGSNVVYTGWITLADDTSTYRAVDNYADASDLTVEAIRAEIDSNSTQLAAILLDTGTTIPGLIAALNNLSAADVNAQADAALADYDGPTKAELDSAIATVTSAISALNDLSAAEVNAEVDTALSDYDGPTKTEMDAALAGLNDPSSAEIADAVWDESITGHISSLTFGRYVYDTKNGLVSIDGTISSSPSGTTTSFETDINEATNDHYNDHVLSFYTGALAGQSRVVSNYISGGTFEFDEAFTDAPANGDKFIVLSIHTHTKSQIAASVWDELTSGHTTSGTFGEQAKTDIDSILSLLTGLNDVSASGVATAVWERIRSGSEPSGSFGYFLDALVSNAGGGTAADIADAVWDEAQSGHTTAGTFGSYLDDKISTVDVEGGEGAYTFTITVDDGSSPLQNATVRLTEGITSPTATTDASGLATFNLDAATYTVAITKSGYSFAGTTEVVSGNGSATYSMSQISPTLSDPGTSTGYLTTYNQSGVIESGVEVAIQFLDIPIGDRGHSFDNSPVEKTTNGAGYVEFTGLIQGAEYRLRRGRGVWDKLRVPTSGTFQLDSVIGNDY